MTAPSSNVSRVLVALSREQREARAPELLARLERPGVEFVYEESAERALELVKELHPRLVLVGMVLETMDGLEVLAILLKRVPDFTGKVVVVPDKGDPFPPMLQGRDPVTRKMTTESIDYARIERLVDEIAPQPSAPPAPAPVVEAPVAPAAPVIEATPASPPPPSPVMAAPIAHETPPSRSRSPVLFIVIGAVVVLGVVIVGVLASRSSPPPLPTSTTSIATQVSTPTTTTAPPASSSTAASTADDGPRLEQPTSLPLKFPRAGAIFEITDAPALDAIVKAIQRGVAGGAKVEVGGHTSEEGSDQFNQDLSQKRAANVKRYLIDHDVAEDAIVLKIYKGTLAAGTSTELNRRVTVRLIR